jgi:hypothetical protein
MAEATAISLESKGKHDAWNDVDLDNRGDSIDRSACHRDREAAQEISGELRRAARRNTEAWPKTQFAE